VKRLVRGLLLLSSALLSSNAAWAQARRMLWGDTSRLGRPFAKDPSVIRFGGRYLLYYSMPPYADDHAGNGWAIGIAESRDLIEWIKAGEFVAGAEYEARGIAAPFAKVIDGRVHLLYQTYGNGAHDAICHAVSGDGLRFERDGTNPIFYPTGDWNAGRAIDAEIVKDGKRWLLYAATRDPAMKEQMVVGAVSYGGWSRSEWKLMADHPLLKPELAWEQNCIEAPTLLQHDGVFYMFYAAAYNNAPQKIGLARSTDGVRWERVGTQPFLANGKPGEWNSSESGHPGLFVDDDGQTYLFFQGNNDNGRTWLLSFVKLGWRNGLPYIAS